jgi:hypothetical protein
VTNGASCVAFATNRSLTTLAMSRRTRARRLARKARAPSQRCIPVGWSEPWGSGAPLTPEERARALSRFGKIKFRSFTTGFTPVLNTWFRAETPEELAEAVRQKLLADTKKTRGN